MTRKIKHKSQALLSETHKAICQQMGVDPELVVKYNPDLANNQGE